MRYCLKPLAIALGAVLAFGCADSPVGDQSATGEIPILADLSDLHVSGLVVEVTADDIPDPLVFNLPIILGVGTGTISVPAGPGRKITVTGLSATTTQPTHRGSTIVDVVEGVNPPISIALIPLTGDLPIEITGDGLIVTLDPPSGTIDAGDVIQFTASVTDSGGTSQNVFVSWGSTNPLVAIVDADGLVTGVGEGTAEIVANAGGAAKAALVIVGAAPVVQYSLPFYDLGLDLDAGTTVTCDIVEGCGSDEWDFYLGYNAATTPSAFIAQNQGTGVEVAFLNGVLFDDVTAADVATADFVLDLVSQPFSDTGVVLVRTPGGLVFKLGNPVEDASQVTFDTQLLTGS